MLPGPPESAHHLRAACTPNAACLNRRKRAHRTGRPCECRLSILLACAELFASLGLRRSCLGVRHLDVRPAVAGADQDESRSEAQRGDHRTT